MRANTLLILYLAGCNLGPRVDDAPDAPAPPDAPPKPDGGFEHILPPGTDVPSIATDNAALVQIRLSDGILDTATCGPAPAIPTCLSRGTGKVAGTTVRFWNFGPTPTEFNGAITIAVVAPMYVLGTEENNVFTPLATHLPLLDTIPGDTRYSAIRRVVKVPVTSLYKGELITNVAALGEALDRGLVTEPTNDGTWVNLPVVLPTQVIAVSGDPAGPVVTASPTQVFAKGYKVDVFELGTSQFGRQPFRANFVPIGQASFLLSGVATGTPPVLTTTPDSQPVLVFPIPTAPPGMTFSYSPVSFDASVRLANGVAPSAITADSDMFRRNAPAPFGAINAFDPANVASFTVQTTAQNIQVQFADGAL